jgi:lysophospholipase L1-like esterase
MGRPLSTRTLVLLLWLTGACTGLVWLGSLGRYIEARHHWNTEALEATALGAVSRLRERLQDALDANSANPSALAGRSGVRVPPPPERWAGLPTPLPPGQFLGDLRQQKLPRGAQRILFVGDSMMKGLAPPVMRALAQAHPDWEMTDLSRQSTGLTLRRHFDWPRRIEQEIETRRLTLLVVFLGPNDPWDLVEDGRRHGFPSTDWAWHYARRVDEVLAAAARRQVRVVWLGLPALPEGRLHQGAVVMNRVFHERARAWRTDYLATEPLVGKLSDPVSRYTVDASGEAVALRTPDGIHFTPTGLRRLRDALLAHIDKAAVP